MNTALELLQAMMNRHFNLPPGTTMNQINDPPPSKAAEECNGSKCETMVEPDEDYFATPCGTYCSECMLEHLKTCEICRHEFGD